VVELVAHLAHDGPRCWADRGRCRIPARPAVVFRNYCSQWLFGRLVGESLPGQRGEHGVARFALGAMLNRCVITACERGQLPAARPLRRMETVFGSCPVPRSARPSGETCAMAQKLT
jgi:hypothetical protein